MSTVLGATTSGRGAFNFKIKLFGVSETSQARRMVASKLAVKLRAQQPESAGA